MNEWKVKKKSENRWNVGPLKIKKEKNKHYMADSDF